jgi:hypothetical protein
MHAQLQERDNEVVDTKNPLHIGPLPSDMVTTHVIWGIF